MNTLLCILMQFQMGEMFKHPVYRPLHPIGLYGYKVRLFAEIGLKNHGLRRELLCGHDYSSLNSTYSPSVSS